MNDLDDLLKQSLDPKTAAALTQEDTVRQHFQEIADVFKGRSRAWGALLVLDMILAGTLFVVSIVGMFRADDLRWTVIWAASAVFFGVAAGIIKLWLYMRINRNRVLREVKRLELAVAVLSAKLH
ncbi:MAG: DUF6768 family protein [Planctomycetota bacterium]